MISAVVLTKDEEKEIEKCLKSLHWCDEIVIVDDFSSDNTLEIVRKMGIKVYKRRLNNDFAAQRNFGLSKTKGDWILFLDADEKVSKLLKKEILLKIKIATCNGFYIRREDIFLGKPLLYGEVGDIKLLRLAKKNCGKWKRKVHEYWQVSGETSVLKNPLSHNKQSLHDFVDKINNYSTIHASENKSEGKTSSIFKIIFYPVGKFIVNYFLKFGFLDGTRGFIMAGMMSFHSFLAWSKLWLKD